MSHAVIETDARDPERFCSCGHHEDEHAATSQARCLATLPDRCSCHGYRLARSARPYRSDLTRTET